ncbi:MAG: C2H2-type zinc finger protein [Thermoplasmata archaeon]|nr:C2H2-type zinc finger protein [Thermoplasmata archaeon]
MRGPPFRAPMPYIEYDEVEAVCSDCGMTFRSGDALDSHRVKVHAAAGGDDAPAAPRRPPLRCDPCQKLFNSPAAFRDHNRIVHRR